MKNKKWYPSWVSNIREDFKKNGWRLKVFQTGRFMGIYNYIKGDKNVTISYTKVQENTEIRICFMPEFHGFAWNQKDGFMQAVDKKGKCIVIEREDWFNGVEVLTKAQ